VRRGRRHFTGGGWEGGKAVNGVCKNDEIGYGEVFTRDQRREKGADAEKKRAVRAGGFFGTMYGGKARTRFNRRGIR